MYDLIFLFFSIPFVLTTERTTFKGAVYEHNVFIPNATRTWVNRSVALSNMMKNIEVYKVQADKAGKAGVDIIVFPEDGIHGIRFTREGIESYLEYIPDPEREVWNPCDDPNRYDTCEIQQSLSCMAKTNNLYIVANMGDKQPCNKITDANCPNDNHYQFNTIVVYNSTGYLIAKYHKINLFFEYQFDYPPNPKSVSFETPFGKFGVMICFDIIFKTPAIDLLEQHNVGNIVFPTAWMDALPILAAVQFHSAFAAGSRVNFLASNIKYTEKKFHGSGIYSPSGYLDFFYSEDNEGKLLIADVPIIWNRQRSTTTKDKFQVNHLFKNNYVFQSEVFHDLYNFKPITGKSGQSKVCHENLCCSVIFEKENETSDIFAFGAFDGLHTYEGIYYLQVCILLKCFSNNLTSCGEPDKRSGTYFKYIKMEGTFTTSYIFPEILLSDEHNLLKLAPGNSWKYANGTLESQSALENPIVSIGMLARVYEKDYKASNNINTAEIIMHNRPIIGLFLLLHMYF